jgi:hypothetical protein
MLARRALQRFWAKSAPATLTPAIVGQQSLKKRTFSGAHLGVQAFPLLERNEKKPQTNKENIKHPNGIGQLANAPAIVSPFLPGAFPFNSIRHLQLQLSGTKYKLRV